MQHVVCEQKWKELCLEIFDQYFSSDFGKWTKFAEGSCSDIYEYKNVLIKVFVNDRDNKDYEILSESHNLEHTPTLYGYIPCKLMIFEKINGTPLEVIAESGIEFKDAWRQQLQNVFDYFKSKSIQIHDLHLNNILVDEDDKLMFVDVGGYYKRNKDEIVKWEVDGVVDDYKYNMPKYEY